jgi:ribosomal protein L37AE/L43A
MSNEDSRYLCPDCGDYVDHKRVKLGYRLCLWCGEEAAKVELKRKASMVQIPYSKGAYQYIHDPQDLCFTNPKRTT